MTSQEKCTRKKILEVAENHFALLGYNGASIRAISKESGVNISAISYYFGSKAELYWEVVEASHTWTLEKTQQIADKAESLEDLALNFFRVLNKNIEKSRNILRLMLTVGVPMASLKGCYVDKKVTEGPLLKIFAEVLKKEVSKKTTEKQSQILAQILLSHLIFSVMSRASFKVFDNKKTPKHLSISHLEQSIKTHTQILIRSLK